MIVNPGIRRFLGSAIQRLFNSASFYAPLTHTAVPQRAATGTTATFTRATTSTWPNNDGYMVTGVAGEIGFVGARRVRNLLGVTSTESLIAWGWSNSLGAITATTATYTALGNQLYATVGGASPVVGTKFCVQIKLSGTQGNKINLYMMNGAATSGGGVQITLTTTPTVYSVTGTVSNSSQHYLWLMPASYLGVPAGTASQVVAVTNAQAEDVTAQTTQTAGEYVSVGVESAPYYHGSMQDGIKCFPTDLSGNPIPAATMLGYLAEGARTNLCLQSNAFTTTWANTGTPTATQNAVGPDGATSAWTLSDNDGAAFEAVRQIIALTAATHTASVFVKKTTGVQASYPLLYLDDAISKGALCTIDTSNGGATVWTAYTGLTIVTSSAVCRSFNDDFWRVELTFLPTAANWTVYLFPAGTTNATQSTGVIDTAAQGSAVFYGAQVELGSFASSYIATTTLAVARNADVLTYSGGDIPNLKTLSATFKRESGVESVGWAVALSDGATSNYESISAASATQARFLGVTGGATQWDVIPSYTAGTTSKAAFSAATNDIKMAKDGVAQTQDTSATVPTVTQLNVGHVAGSFQFSGNVGGIYGWTRNLSQSELNAVTS